MSGELVTILHRTEVGTDPYGQSVYGWPEPGTTVESLGVAPRGSQEPAEVGRQQVITGLTVYLPRGVQVTAYDRVIARGETWEVEGEPGLWVNPYTTEPSGLEVALKHPEG